MTFSFKEAVREQTSLLIAIAGATGTGKTYSALRLATGLAGPNGKIAFIDTEAGRGLHYADRFKYAHGELRPPFTPMAYTQAIQAAEREKFDVVIIDSMSHEYEGEGGIIEWADRLANGGMKPPKNWTEPKTAHKKMVNLLLQSRAHLIFCLRSEDKIKITKDPNTGKMVIIQPQDIPVHERWIPICEKRFMYEMTVSMVMTPDNPGVPVPVKIQEQHRFAFPSGKQVDEASGRALAEWARGIKVPPEQSVYSKGQAAPAGDGGNTTMDPAVPGPSQAPVSGADIESGLDPAEEAELLKKADRVAEHGKQHFIDWVNVLPDQQKNFLRVRWKQYSRRWS